MSEIHVTENLVLVVHDADHSDGPAVVICRPDDEDERITIYPEELRHLVAKLPEAAVLMLGRAVSVDETRSGNGGGSSWAEP